MVGVGNKCICPICKHDTGVLSYEKEDNYKFPWNFNCKLCKISMNIDLSNSFENYEVEK